MKKLSFMLVLLSVLFLSCSLEARPPVTIPQEHQEYRCYIRLASTNETHLYYCYKTIADAKKCNRSWIRNIDSWRDYAIENPILDSNVKSTMIYYNFEVTATDLPNERRYIVNIYQNNKFYVLAVYY
jgi:hypothetical protein